MKKNFHFRSWYYFRIGWSTYFALMFASINTLTITYYLAIENYPFLKAIFPTFEQYIVIMVCVAVPLLITTGYVHFKKTKAYRSEADIWFETNPYTVRYLVNSELSLQLSLKLSKIIALMSKGEKLNDEQLQELTDLQKKYSDHLNSRTLDNKEDEQYFPH